jgi:hypothetical protein
VKIWPAGGRNPAAVLDGARDFGWGLWNALVPYVCIVLTVRALMEPPPGGIASTAVAGSAGWLMRVAWSNRRAGPPTTGPKSPTVNE